MNEETIRAYAALRAHKLMLNGAQRFHFTESVVARWAAGEQCETALMNAAKEIA
jgi:hypothetical protein